MKQFLVCSGVRGREKGLEWLRKVVEERQPEGIFFAGGVLDATRQFAPHYSGWKMTATDAAFVEKFFKTIGQLKTFSAIIPGPGDIPIEYFLRMGMHAEIDFPGLHLVHATRISKGNIAVGGMGGLVVENNKMEMEAISRTMAEYFLRGLCQANQPYRILLLSSPPTGYMGGQSGNSISSFFIDSIHPNICVVGGDSDRRGVVRVAHTLVINPGCLSDGYAAWVDLNQNVGNQVEMLDFHLSPELAAMEIGISD